MKVVMLYRPKSEHARLAEEYVHDIDRQQNVQVNLVDIDSQQGLAMANLYDIMSHPALLVLREDGQLVQHWADNQLPLKQEVAAFIHR